MSRTTNRYNGAAISSRNPLLSPPATPSALLPEHTGPSSLMRRGIQRFGLLVLGGGCGSGSRSVFPLLLLHGLGDQDLFLDDGLGLGSSEDALNLADFLREVLLLVGPKI